MSIDTDPSLPALIVVTDLDGTLLDHHTYAFTAALPALKELEQQQIPLVLNSSKTAAEIMQLRNAIGNDQPFIIENGAAIHFPDGSIESFGMNRALIIEAARALRTRHDFCFRGFSDLTVEELMTIAALDRHSAELALEREFTEPLLWQDSEEHLEIFLQALAAEGIQAVRGGRFLHLSAPVDKGMAVNHLKQYYAEHITGSVPLVIALGDSENDRSMLECADYPVLVRSPVKPFPEISHPALVRTRLEGPAGWNEAVLHLLDELLPVDEKSIL